MKTSMMRWQHLGTLLAVMGVWSLGGCAATSDGNARNMPTAYGDRVCTVERPLGSHMPQRVCRSKAEIEAERKAAGSALDQIRKAPSTASQQQ